MQQRNTPTTVLKLMVQIVCWGDATVRQPSEAVLVHPPPRSTIWRSVESCTVLFYST